MSATQMIQYVKDGLNDFGFRYYHLFQGFRRFPYEEYLLHEDRTTRKYALIAFCLYLGGGWVHSTIPFEEKRLEEFTTRFVSRHEAFREEFPVVYQEVLFLLGRFYEELAPQLTETTKSEIERLPIESVKEATPVRKLCSAFGVPTSDTF